MKSQGLPILLIIFLMFTPDLDGFVLEKSGHVSLFELLTKISILEQGNLLVQLYLVLVLPIFLLSLPKQISNGKLAVALTVSLLVILFSFFSLFGAGIGILGSLRMPYMVNMGLTISMAGIIGSSRSYEGNIVPVIKGLIAVGCLKICYGAFEYLTVGGVEFVQGVSSFAADGGTLNLWSFLILISSSFTMFYAGSGKRANAVIYIIIGLISLVAVALSFRRNVAIRSLLFVLSALLLLYWCKKKIFRGIAISIFGSVILAGTVIGLMAFNFGSDLTIERLRSFELSEASEFGASNALYIDDWTVLFDAIISNLPMGSGLGQPYGIERIHVSEGISEPPLHVGSFELWASVGFAGILYHIAILIYLPIKTLSEIELEVASLHPLRAAGLIFTLFTAVWPFGPPFLAGTQSSVLVGIALGLICSPAIINTPSLVKMRAQ